MALIEPIPGLEVSNKGFDVGEKYFFHDQANGKPALYQHLLSKATASITIWDPYFTLSAAEIFSEIRQNGLHINILTLTKQEQKERDVDDLIDQIAYTLRNNELSRFEIEINCYLQDYIDRAQRDVKNRVKLKMWHDRFLIIDGIYAYLVGSSLDEQRDSLKNFGICFIDNSNDRDLIIEKMNECKELCMNNNKGPNKIGCYKKYPK